MSACVDSGKMCKIRMKLNAITGKIITSWQQFETLGIQV
jgi:hypothetical protein